MTHQRPQTGDLVVCWAFVPHYYQPVIRQAHGQPSIPSEGSSLSPSSLPPHAATTIQIDWGLAGVIEMLQGEHPASLTRGKKTSEWKKDRDITLKEEGSRRRATFIVWIRGHEKTSAWSADTSSLPERAYLSIFTFSVNCEGGFGPSADKHAS